MKGTSMTLRRRIWYGVLVIFALIGFILSWYAVVRLLSPWNAVKLLTFEANRLEPVKLNERLFLFALILFLAYSIYWSIKLIRSFRIPVNN